MFFLFCSADSRFFPQMYSSLALQNETQMDNKRKRKRKAERNIKDSHCRRMIDTLIFALSFLLLLLFLSSCRIRPSFTGMHCLSLSRIAFPPLSFALFSPSLCPWFCVLPVSLRECPSTLACYLTRDAIVLPIHLLLVFHSLLPAYFDGSQWRRLSP